MRITGIDFHPTEPWVLGTTYTGCVYIWNYIVKEVVKFFKVSEVAVRTGKFIARKNWIVVACDDARLYVFNIESMDIIKVIPHSDKIKEIEIHQTKSWVMAACDDKNILLFDWDDNWKYDLTLMGHTGAVTSLALHPQNPSILVSGSLDGTVQEWNFEEQTQSIIRVTHSKGVVCVRFQNKNPPQLISASEDGEVKIMKEEGGFGLKGEVIGFYYPFSLVVTGTKDGVIRLYSSTENGYNFEKAFSVGGPIWTIANDNNKIAYGNDSGLFILEILNTVDGLDIKTEAMPFTGQMNVEQFSSSIIRDNKFVPVLDGVMNQEEYTKYMEQISGNTKNNVKAVLKSAVPAGGAFYLLSFFMPVLLIMFFTVLASGAAAVKFKKQKKALTLPTQAATIDQVNKDLQYRNVSFKNENNQISVQVKKRGVLPDPEEILYIEAPSSSSSHKPISASISSISSSVSSSVSSIASSIPAAVSSIPSSLSSIQESIPSLPSIPTFSASISSSISNIPSAISTIPSSIASIQDSIPSIPTISSSISAIPSSIATSISSLTSAPPASLSSSDFPNYSSSSSAPTILYSNVHHNVAIPAHSIPASNPNDEEYIL